MPEACGDLFDLACGIERELRCLGMRVRWSIASTGTVYMDVSARRWASRVRIADHDPTAEAQVRPHHRCSVEARYPCSVEKAVGAILVDLEVPMAVAERTRRLRDAAGRNERIFADV